MIISPTRLFNPLPPPPSLFLLKDFELQNHHGQYHHTMLDPDTFLGDLSSSSTLPHLFTRLIELIPGPGLFRFKPTDTLFAQLLVSRIPHTSTIFNLLWNIPEARPEFDGRDDEEWEWILSMLTIAVVAGRRDVVAKNLLLEWVEIRGRRVQQGENGFNVVSQQFDEIVAQLDQQQPFINDDGVGAGNLQLHLLKSLAVEFDLEPCEKVVELIMAVERPDLLDILLRFLNGNL